VPIHIFHLFLISTIFTRSSLSRSVKLYQELVYESLIALLVGMFIFRTFFFFGRMEVYY
jgi:hypothetical protein